MISLNDIWVDNDIKSIIVDDTVTTDLVQKKLRWDNSDLTQYYPECQVVLQPLYNYIDLNFTTWCNNAPFEADDSNLPSHKLDLINANADWPIPVQCTRVIITT
jgi:hypothetical protein